MLQALGDRILIEPEKVKNTTDSGIYMPEADNEPSHRGIVMSAGPRCEVVKDGQMVMFHPHGGYQTEYAGKMIYIFHECDIMGIIEPNTA